MIELLKTKAGWISLQDRRNLGTLNFVISAIHVVDNFMDRDWQKLEGFFRQEAEKDGLLVKIMEGLDGLGIEYSLD